MERKKELEKLLKDNLPKGLPKATKKILESAAEKFAKALQNYYEMPCALGDTVTDISEYFDGTENPSTYCFVAERIAIEQDENGELVYLINNELCYKKEEFGKTVFFGSEGIKQAEEAKKERLLSKAVVTFDEMGKYAPRGLWSAFGDYEFMLGPDGTMKYKKMRMPADYL